MPIYSPRRGILGLLWLLPAVWGCEPLAAGDRLVVATRWPAAERARIESEYRAWLGQDVGTAAGLPSPIDWLILAPGDDLDGLAARRRPPDVLLGGPANCYRRLSRAGRLAPLPIGGHQDWAVSREDASDLKSFDDPRRDPLSLARADALLARGGFRQGYGRLIEAVGQGRRAGPRIGPEAPVSGPIRCPEGIAIVRGTPHRDQAAMFLKFLAETDGARPIPTSPDGPGSEESDLLADLLGATLVDARDELRAAWMALVRADPPPGPLRWMTEPPPWPPASIAKILDGPGEQAMAMAETLAGQVAPDPSARAWLVSSWLSPPRPIDRTVLAGLARAADGRLLREPRFREWLRAEWTAWARQRYRRVLRSIEVGPAPASPPSSDH